MGPVADISVLNDYQKFNAVSGFCFDDISSHRGVLAVYPIEWTLT
jgi:hypothetical protein